LNREPTLSARYSSSKLQLQHRYRNYFTRYRDLSADAWFIMFRDMFAVTWTTPSDIGTTHTETGTYLQIHG
jgi:hypothetical protein